MLYDRFSERFLAWRLSDLSTILKVDLESVPQIFNRRKPKIIKVGCFHDVLDRYPEADHEKLREWFNGWCSTEQYLLRMLSGTNRHDLDGNDCGIIDNGSKINARSKLEKRLAKKARKLQNAA